MNMESAILLTPAVLTALSLAIAVLCLARLRKYRRLVDFAEKQIQDLQHTTDLNKETIEKSAERFADMSRRLLWLETRIRQPKKTSDDVLDETTIHEAPKLNITERRHRVFTLASRGQNAETIAKAIGMLPGEVELIMDLDQAARNRR